MAPAPSRFDLINHRLRQVAVTIIIWSAALACIGETVAYIIALVSGNQAEPPVLRLLGIEFGA